MINETQIKELEHALQSRAQALAEEFRARGHAERDRIVRETNEKLRLREEREVLAAKALANRSYQQKVQAGELRLQASLDRLRWTLVEGALDSVAESLERVAEDESRYMPILKALVKSAAEGIGTERMTVWLNRRDHARLADAWEIWSAGLSAKGALVLAADPIECIGGALVQDAEAQVRVDNTFEGRLERMRDELQQTVVERLFASLPEAGVFFNG